MCWRIEPGTAGSTVRRETLFHVRGIIKTGNNSAAIIKVGNSVSAGTQRIILI